MERSAITCLPAGGMCSASLLVEFYLFIYIVRFDVSLIFYRLKIYSDYGIK